MSSIVNRIATTFTASAGNVRAVMGEVSGSMNGINRSIQQTSRNSGYLSNQLRAVGTTLRYALAGTAVFGASNLVRQLSALQTQTALMVTLQPDIERTTGSIGNLLDTLQKGSNEALTPLNELGDATVNLLSSIQGVRGDDVTRIPTMLAEAAQLAQTPVEDLTKGVTGMIQAFGEAPTGANFEGLARGFLTLTRRAPGGISAGPQIVQQLGPAALAARLAHISPQQLFGLTNTVLRAGGSPATAMRGLNFLLQAIATPNKAEAKVLGGLGITPDFVQQRGGLAAIEKLVQTMKTRGVTGNISRNAPIFQADDETLSNIESMGMGDLQGLGVGGQGLQLAQRAIGRIHGVRALIAILQQMNPETGHLTQDITAADQAVRGIGENGTALSDQFKDFRRRQPLRAASIALQNLALEAPRALQGILNPIARQADRVGQLAVDHPHGTRRVMQVAAGALAAIGITRFLRGGKLGFGQAFVNERAIQASTNPERAAILGGSPQNPMYVTVVGQLFGRGDSLLSGGGAAKRSGNLLERLAEGFGAGAGAGRLGRLARLRTVAAGGAVPALAVVGGYEILTGHLAPGDSGMQNRHIGPLLHRAGQMYSNLAEGDPRRLIIDQLNKKRITDRQAEVQLKAAFAQANRLNRLNEILRPFHRRDPLYGVTAIYGQKKEMINGKAEVTLDVNLATDKGQVRKKIHVPMDLWTGGRTPSQRGQAGKTKANIP
jgi:hypothetical protein